MSSVSPSHYIKVVYVRGFSEIYFPAFGLNKEIYIVNLSIQSKCGKIRTRKTPITDIFHAVPAAFFTTNCI